MGEGEGTERAKEGGGDREGANLNQVGSQCPNIVLYRFVNRIFTKIQRIIRGEGRGKGEIRERGAWSRVQRSNLPKQPKRTSLQRSTII